MSKKTLNNSRNSQYQIISFEEQIQNDKERIRRKFNFTNSNNNSLNSSNISDIQSQLSICSKKKNLNNKNEQIIIEKKSEKSSITEIIEEAIGNNKSIKLQLIERTIIILTIIQMMIIIMLKIQKEN
jgi:hypothetical protein